MDFDKPLWKASLAGLLIRVPIGLYLFLSGRLLLQDVDGLVEAIKSFELVNENLAVLYANCFPYAEIVLGVLLVIGFWTSLTAILTCALLASVIYAFGIYPNDTIPFNKDIIWFCATLSLLASGPGAFSIDSFRNKGS